MKHARAKVRAANAKQFKPKKRTEPKTKKRIKKKLSTRPRKKGFSYGADGKLHKVVRKRR